MYKYFFKRIFDFLIALIAFILLFPILLIVSLLIKIDSDGPIIFKQKRLGYKGKEFEIYKFRSMRVHQIDPSKAKLLSEDDERITKMGKFVRKTSIDELPQLLNILKGDMSFIGPRPPVTYFPKKIEDYTAFELERFNVRPGISGLAQVRCRENHDWNINFPIDVEYVRNYSFSYDLKLFLISLTFFFRTNNIYTPKK